MATTSMDVVAWLRNQLQEANPDLLREMVGTFAESLMSADATEGRPPRIGGPRRPGTAWCS